MIEVATIGVHSIVCSVTYVIFESVWCKITRKAARTGHTDTLHTPPVPPLPAPTAPWFASTHSKSTITLCTFLSKVTFLTWHPVDTLLCGNALSLQSATPESVLSLIPIIAISLECRKYRGVDIVSFFKMALKLSVAGCRQLSL